MTTLSLFCGMTALLFGFRWFLHRSLAPEATITGARPEELGMRAEAVRISGSRGLRLFAWYVPSTCAVGAASAPAVVLLHGWGGNASSLLPAAHALHRAGYAVLLPESRNHGRSDRDSHSSLPRFAVDLDCALDWLSGQPGVDATRLAAVGHSVGGAAVLLAASRRRDLRAAVSVAAFAHPEQVMRRWLAAHRIPYLPLGWMVNRYVERVIGKLFDDIAPVATLPDVICPVLLVHGRQDMTVPVEDARYLFQSCGEAEVTLLELDGSHDTFADLERASRELVAFLDRTCKNESSAADRKRAT